MTKKPKIRAEAPNINILEGIITITSSTTTISISKSHYSSVFHFTPITISIQQNINILMPFSLWITMNIKQFLHDLKKGIRSKYPPCCILQFCIDSLLGNEGASVFRYVRNLKYTPCWLHMKAYHQDAKTAKLQLMQDSDMII